uniref:AlNc14C29G2776 protein n=1 Tax=Albugo laibachii Nc14 TaxID=890382 RepID=F0W7G3_9STRA|nr:AlNc14C29G2776 [Albugo laibachii Nc14]|eukprot:CCA17064.1 AlNc14C29G2776 [Albugo laibachii Nc14]
MDQHYSASAYGERCTLVRTSPLLCFSKGKIYIFAVLDNVEADLHRDSTKLRYDAFHKRRDLRPTPFSDKFLLPTGHSSMNRMAHGVYINMDQIQTVSGKIHASDCVSSSWTNTKADGDAFVTSAYIYDQIEFKTAGRSSLRDQTQCNGTPSIWCRPTQSAESMTVAKYFLE